MAETRYIPGGGAYMASVTGSQPWYRVTGRTWTGPEAETGLAGCHHHEYGYAAADNVTSATDQTAAHSERYRTSVGVTGARRLGLGDLGVVSRYSPAVAVTGGDSPQSTSVVVRISSTADAVERCCP